MTMIHFENYHTRIQKLMRDNNIYIMYVSL